MARHGGCLTPNRIAPCTPRCVAFPDAPHAREHRAPKNVLASTREKQQTSPNRIHTTPMQFWDMKITMGTFLLDFSWMGVFLLAAFVVRSRSRWLHKHLIPANLLGGVLGLMVGSPRSPSCTPPKTRSPKTSTQSPRPMQTPPPPNSVPPCTRSPDSSQNQAAPASQNQQTDPALAATSPPS